MHHLLGGKGAGVLRRGSSLLGVLVLHEAGKEASVH